jgi:hypothetical protein
MAKIMARKKVRAYFFIYELLSKTCGKFRPQD